MSHPSTIIGLDVGAQRIGVALGSQISRLAHPLKTLRQSDDVYDQIASLVAEHAAAVIVVGLPRAMSGQTTQQTAVIDAFIAELSQHTTIPIDTQDETLTSVKAQTELEQRTKTYQKGDIDSLAATYIVEDFLANTEVPNV